MTTLLTHPTGRHLAAGLLLVALLLATTTAAGRPAALRFESEVVRLVVAPDSLTVDGFYVMSCAPDRSGNASLFYPYPHDDRLGGARSLRLEVRVRPDTTWQPAEFRELDAGRGAVWRLPLAPGDTLEVHTVYRQALHERFARYIVTTMKGWEHPLRHARFEIELPDGAEPEWFSFPFERCDRDGRRVWCYEATEFRPENDIDVTWRPAADDAAQVLGKMRYTWDDEELPVDEMILEPGRRQAAEITADEARRDVEHLFYLLAHGYSGYGFFDQGTNWAQARRDILAALQTRPSWRVQDLPPLIREHLDFVRDCHLMLDDLPFATHQDWWYDTDHTVQLDLRTFRVVIDGEPQTILAINGQPPRDYLFQSLNSRGEPTWRLGTLARTDPGDLTLEIAGEAGPRRVTVPLRRSRFDHHSRKIFDRDEIGGIPVLRVRSFSDHWWRQLEAFVETAGELRDTPVVIVDVRGNHGGNERWPNRWIHGMSGRYSDWPFIFSELKSRTAVVGRANAMAHWSRITPDSEFLQNETARFQDLLDDYRRGDVPPRWTGPLYPDTNTIPNRTTIVVVTNGLVGSAGEGFVMRVARLENVVLVGENTRGALTFGNMSLHRLPHSGLDAWLPVNFGLFPDLVFREERGLEPDYWVPAADAVNHAVAAIRNGTIDTAIPLPPAIMEARFVPEDSRHIRRKLIAVCAAVLVGLVWVASVWRRRGRLVIPGTVWILIGAIWMMLGHRTGKALMTDLGGGLVILGCMFMLGALVSRLSRRPAGGGSQDRP